MFYVATNHVSCTFLQDAIVEGYKVLGAKTAAYLHKGKDWESFYDIALTRFQDIIDFEIEMSHVSGAQN